MEKGKEKLSQGKQDDQPWDMMEHTGPQRPSNR